MNVISCGPFKLCLSCLPSSPVKRQHSTAKWDQGKEGKLTDCRNERRSKCIVGEPEKDASLADSGVADQQQLEQQVVCFLGHLCIAHGVL